MERGETGEGWKEREREVREIHTAELEPATQEHAKPASAVPCHLHALQVSCPAWDLFEFSRGAFL